LSADADLHVVLRRRGFRGEDASGRQLRTRNQCSLDVSFQVR
jgi:hypothetical protein